MNIVDLSPAYFPNPATGIPIALGFVYVGEPDTDPTVVANQKDIFLLQENGTFVATAQPVTLGAGGLPTYNGSTVTIYVTGDYSIRVDDSANAQIYYIPRTSAQEATGTQFPVWDIGTTYAQNSYVTGSDDRLYYSIAGANLGNDPTSTSGFWQGFLEVGDSFNVTGSLIGDVLSGDGLVAVVENGTDGTDAMFTGDVVGDMVGDVYSEDGLVKVLENGPDGTGATFEGSASKVGVLNVKEVDIGDWDMDAASTVFVTHGIADLETKVSEFSAVIRNDAGTHTYNLSFSDTVSGLLTGAAQSVNATQITLVRLDGGFFDSVSFDSTPLNRGVVTIWYTD